MLSDLPRAQDSSCCGNNLASVTNYELSPPPPPTLQGPNECAGSQPFHANAAANNGAGDNYFRNTNCSLASGVIDVLEQAGANVTAGYVGGFDAGGRTPITTPYWQAGLCPVNVHWHAGAEHYSAGQFDEAGVSPTTTAQLTHPSHTDGGRRMSAGPIRHGFKCHHYDAAQTQYTQEYDWKYCTQTHVGETYEIHWPHSAAGACGTPNQYQSPFYDGVFCRGGIISLSPLNTYTTIGVQAQVRKRALPPTALPLADALFWPMVACADVFIATPPHQQVFTIVNNESYYYPDLLRGMIVDGAYGADIAKYTGSTTGTSRDNTMCSRYTPITWQVDRKCHLISARSFDKLCQDMQGMRDDMTSDLHAHGSRALVANQYVANNQQS